MMNYLELAGWLLLCVADAVILYIWLKGFYFTKRKNPRLRYAALVLLILISAAALFYANSIENIIFKLCVQAAFYIAISLLLFEKQVKRLMLYTIINYVIGMSAELILSTAFGMAGVYSWNGSETAFLLFTRVVKFAVCLLIIKIFSLNTEMRGIWEEAPRDKTQYGLTGYLIFCSIPAASAVTLSAFEILQSTRPDSGIGLCILAQIAAVGVIFVNAVIIFFYEELDIMLKKVKRLESENTRYKLKEKYYTDLDDTHQKYDVFLHDIRHSIRTVAALSEEGNCEEIKGIMESMRTSLGSIDERLICSNKILNALLSERKGYAGDIGVELEFKISEPLRCEGIEDLDLITLIGNLLDNAIGAESHARNKGGVLCSMHMSADGGHMVICVENSYEEKGGFSIKAKESIGEKHGIGLASVQEIVSKYGGIFESAKSGGRYNVKLLLPVQTALAGEEAYAGTLPAYAQPAYK